MNGRIYELRVYTAMPGRLPDLLLRFEDHTFRIWERLGIRWEGLWTTLVGTDSNAVTYFLVWESLSQRDLIWNVFLADSEWKAARQTSEANGPILRSISSQILVQVPRTGPRT